MRLQFCKFYLKSGILYIVFYKSRIISSDALLQVWIQRYETRLRKWKVWEEVDAEQNVCPSLHSLLGLYGGLLNTGSFHVLVKVEGAFTCKHGGEGASTDSPVKEEHL